MAAESPPLARALK